MKTKQKHGLVYVPRRDGFALEETADLATCRERGRVCVRYGHVVL